MAGMEEACQQLESMLFARHLFRYSLLPLSSFQTLRCLFSLSKRLQTFYIIHTGPFLDFTFPFHISFCSISPFHIYSCSWSSLWTCLLPPPVSEMNVPDHLLWQFPLRALSSAPNNYSTSVQMFPQRVLTLSHTQCVQLFFGSDLYHLSDSCTCKVYLC